MQKKDVDKAVEEFQRRFSEFMERETGDGKPVREFVLFYLLQERGGGVVQSFGDPLEGLAYTAHVMSTILQKGGAHHKAIVVQEGGTTGIVDLEEVDHETKPN